MRTKGATVSAYIAAAPPAARLMLRQLRTLVRAAAPQAEERMSYGMPYYSWHGRLVYFAGYTKHVSVYIMDAARLVLPTALQKYRTSKSTLQFPVGTKLPSALLQRLIRSQVRANQAHA